MHTEYNEKTGVALAVSSDSINFKDLVFAEDAHAPEEGWLKRQLKMDGWQVDVKKYPPFWKDIGLKLGFGYLLVIISSGILFTVRDRSEEPNLLFWFLPISVAISLVLFVLVIRRMHDNYR